MALTRLASPQADVNAANLHGTHPLHIAVKREYTDCIRHLMAQSLPVDKVREIHSFLDRLHAPPDGTCISQIH